MMTSDTSQAAGRPIIIIVIFTEVPFVELLWQVKSRSGLEVCVKFEPFFLRSDSE
jgi:hypothetical protein